MKKINWQLTMSSLFIASILGAIFFIGRLSSPNDQKKDRELASLSTVKVQDIQMIQQARLGSSLKEAQPREEKARAHFFEKYFEEGRTVTLNKREFIVSETLRAGFQEVLGPNQVEVLFRGNGMVFFEVDDSAEYQEESKMPVVFDRNRQSVGVVTGKIMVKFHSEKDFDRLRHAYNLEHYYHAKGIDAHYFVIQKGSDPFEVFEEIINLGFVERAELEVVEEVPGIK